MTDTEIEERTAFVLGPQRGSLTISDRRDDGVRTTYTVRSERGDQFNCHVTGIVSVSGRIISDANKNDEFAKNPLI